MTQIKKKISAPYRVIETRSRVSSERKRSAGLNRNVAVHWAEPHGGTASIVKAWQSVEGVKLLIVADSNIKLPAHGTDVEIVTELPADLAPAYYVCTAPADSTLMHINAGRLAGACVITTDAAPMNEVVDNKSGVLVAAGESIPMPQYAAAWTKWPAKVSFAVATPPSTAAILEGVNRAIVLTDSELSEIGEAATARYAADAKHFDATLAALVEEVLKHPVNVSARDSAAVFDHVYKTRHWALKKGMSLSGKGSGMKETAATRKIIIDIARRRNVRTIYDGACGDMTWMPAVLAQLPGVKYTGADASPHIIAENKKAHRTGAYKFVVANLADSKIPAVDLVILKDVIQHMSSADIAKALDNIATSGSRYLLATTYPAQTAEESLIDIRPGMSNLRNLRNPPISLPAPLEIFDAKDEGKYLGLWSLPFAE